MAYTKVTHTSYGDRIVNSFKGIVVGLLLLVIGTVLLFWNEGRTVRTSDTIEEARKAAVEMGDISRINAELDGKLVHATGRAETADTVTDSMTGVSANAIRLERRVEYYQWEESSKKETRKNAGGSSKTVTTYDYNMKWVDEPIDSSKFEYVSGHENTVSARIEDETVTAPNVTFGAYRIPDFMKDSIGKDEPVEVGLSPQSLDLLSDSEGRLATVNGNVVYIGHSSGNPKVGDVRITYLQRKPAEISLLAVSKGDTFAEFASSNGGEFWQVGNGVFTAEEMFSEAEKGNSVLAWILRGVGTVLVMAGIGMIFAPLGTLADVVPLLGSIIGAGAGLIAIMLGLAWSLVIIAIAWMVYRPLLGIGLLAAATALIVLLVLRGLDRRKRQAAQPAQPVSIPQPIQPASVPQSVPLAAAQPAPGQPAPGRRFCTSCGAAHTPGTRFCSACGTQLQ